MSEPHVIEQTAVVCEFIAQDDRRYNLQHALSAIFPLLCRIGSLLRGAGCPCAARRGFTPVHAASDWSASSCCASSANTFGAIARVCHIAADCPPTATTKFIAATPPTAAVRTVYAKQLPNHHSATESLVGARSGVCCNRRSQRLSLHGCSGRFAVNQPGGHLFGYQPAARRQQSGIPVQPIGSSATAEQKRVERH